MKDNASLHMRTINEAAEYFKSVDPCTALKKNAIRRLVSSGEVPSVRIGNKYLVSLEALNEYLSAAMPAGNAAPKAVGIRPVEVGSR